MTLDKMTVPVNWFDLLVVIVILLGINRGRKHGMSEEMMVMLQWLAIVFAGAFLYKPIGDYLADTSPMGHLFWYIAAYVALAIVTKIVFLVFKKATGGKLVGSSIFGGAEYYLGMVAGAIRFLCMLVVALALLNAPYYSVQQIAANTAYQNDMYGSNFFPGIAAVQQQIFKESLIGSLVQQRATFLLIAPTKQEHKGIKRREDAPV
jgi:uncharacterized membrane protein required for colicin V production